MRGYPVVVNAFPEPYHDHAREQAEYLRGEGFSVTTTRRTVRAYNTEVPVFVVAGWPPVPDEDDGRTYKLVRAYTGDYRPQTVATGLTLEQARTYCVGTEASSETARGRRARRRTERYGPWRVHYEPEGADKREEEG